jgi:rare lipoprotein A
MSKSIVLLLLLLRARPAAAEGSIVTDSLHGAASWYGGHHVGRKTANGEIFTRHLRTAAHRDLPFGALVRVVNLRNHRAVVVRINDRGPFVGGRIIDLSERAARDLQMIGAGVVEVRLELLSPNH